MQGKGGGVFDREDAANMAQVQSNFHKFSVVKEELAQKLQTLKEELARFQSNQSWDRAHEQGNPEG